MRKTIVIIADFGYVEGGAAKVALDSVRLLHKAGYKVILFCGSEKVDPEIAALGIRIEKLGLYQLKENPSQLDAMISGLWNRQAAAKLKSLLKALDPEKTVVHIHTWTKILSPSVFSVLRRSGFRTVMTCHDYFLACPNGAFYDYVHHRICPYRGGGLRCLICSCDARNYAQKVWRWIRHRVVSEQLRRWSGLTLLTVSDLEDDILRRRLRRGLEYVRVNNPMTLRVNSGNTVAGKSVFLYVGRASPEKGLELFAQAVTECGVRGRVIGDGPELQPVRKRYPGIDYRGWKSPEEVYEILQSDAAVLIFPSRCREPAALSPQEAMANGVPCILSDVTSSTEYVEDGETGLVFKSGDVEDLKRKIERMKDPSFRVRLSANIRKRFDISKWDAETYIRKVTRIYEGIRHD